MNKSCLSLFLKSNIKIVSMTNNLIVLSLLDRLGGMVGIFMKGILDKVITYWVVSLLAGKLIDTVVLKRKLGITVL